MPEGSRPSDLQKLETEHVRTSERITRLTEAINELENARTLRADAAARLVKYRENRERLEYERWKLEWEIQGPRGAPQADRSSSPTLADATLRPGAERRKEATGGCGELRTRVFPMSSWVRRVALCSTSAALVDASSDPSGRPITD